MTCSIPGRNYPNTIKNSTEVFFLQRGSCPRSLLSGKWCLAGGDRWVAEGRSLQSKGLFAEAVCKWIKEAVMGA